MGYLVAVSARLYRSTYPLAEWVRGSNRDRLTPMPRSRR